MDNRINPTQETPQDPDGSSLNSANDTGTIPLNLHAIGDISELVRNAAIPASAPPLTSAYDAIPFDEGGPVDTTAAHVSATALFDFAPVAAEPVPVPAAVPVPVPAAAPVPVSVPVSVPVPAAAPTPVPASVFIPTSVPVAAAAPVPVMVPVSAPVPVAAAPSPVVGLDLGAAPNPNTRVAPAPAVRIGAEAAFEDAIAQDELPATPVVESTEEAVEILDPGSTNEFPPVGLINEDIEKQATAAVAEIQAAQLAVASAEFPVVDEPVSYAAEEAVAEEEPVEKGISVITREATVLGDIITEGHIDIVGRVKGNVDAKGDVAIHGIVRGDVGGEKIGLYSCRVKGNLDAGLGVIVDESSILGGDVKTQNIIFDGKVKGNIDADNIVVLRSHSYCLGDVSATSLAIEPGAILNGKVRTFVKGDLEAPFDEVM